MDKIIRTKKYAQSRVLPALTVDAATHAALMNAIQATGDSLANIMNQVLILGLKKYGMSPAKFRPDPRDAQDVIKQNNKRNLLKALMQPKGRFPGFFINRELQESVRLFQGVQTSQKVMEEALQMWVESKGQYIEPEPKERPVREKKPITVKMEPIPLHKRQEGTFQFQNFQGGLGMELKREMEALKAGVPLSTLKPKPEGDFC
jgi:hypothetical protein